MKLIIIAIGKEKDFSGSEVVAEYTSRISHYLPIEWRYITASNVQDEEKSIMRMIEKEGAGSYCIALDEIGKQINSVQLSEFIQVRMNESTRSLMFIIGGSYGLSDTLRKQVQSVISLSKMTFPHQIVRLILAEQIYRACTIMKGEKYHH